MKIDEVCGKVFLKEQGKLSKTCGRKLGRSNGIP